MRLWLMSHACLIRIRTFPMCPPNLILDTKWRLLHSQRFRNPEHIHLKEMRAVIWALKHDSRQTRNHDQRRLHLCDNLSIVLALEKGRCSDPALLVLCRRFASFALACGVRYRIRWIPSEGNPSDDASRWWLSIFLCGRATGAYTGSMHFGGYDI